MLAQLPSLALAALPYIHVREQYLGFIRPFGVLVVIGILIGARLGSMYAKRVGLDKEKFSSLIFWTVFSGIVLSHVLDQIFYYPRQVILEPWRLLMIWQGLSSFGGFAGALFGFFLYGRSRRINLWLAADALGFGLAFGWFFGRLGCTVVHDHPGVRSDSFFAVAYPGGARFDLGLLEASLVPLLMITVLLVARFWKRPGAVVTSLALVYPFLRFPLDFLRAPEWDGGDVRYFHLTPGQYASIGMLLLGLHLLRQVVSGATEAAAAGSKAVAGGKVSSAGSKAGAKAEHRANKRVARRTSP